MPETKGILAAPKEEAPDELAAPESGNGFDSGPIEQSITQEVPPEFKDPLKRVVDAGSKFMFTGEGLKLFEDIREDQPLADQMGMAAVNVMGLLINKSRGTMPGEVVIPAGVILLARAAEFISDEQIAPVTEQDFSEAATMFHDVIVAKLDEQEQGGQQPQPVQPGQGQPAPGQAPGQAPAPQAGGILQAGG
jgi:hypothetical protein